MLRKDALPQYKNTIHRIFAAICTECSNLIAEYAHHRSGFLLFALIFRYVCSLHEIFVSEIRSNRLVFTLPISCRKTCRANDFKRLFLYDLHILCQMIRLFVHRNVIHLADNFRKKIRFRFLLRSVSDDGYRPASIQCRITGCTVADTSS